MKWAIAAAVAVLAVVVIAPWVYINFIREDAPDRLTLDTDTSTSVATADPTTTAAETATTEAETGTATTTPAAAETTAPAAASGISGTWNATPESVLGYRVKEILFGQDTEGVGRTNAVTGGLVVEGTTVSSADFTVDMTTIESDQSRRDDQFRGRIMDVEQFPTATFTLTQPIQLTAEPADGERFTATATGDLTLRGTTKPVTFEIEGERAGDTFRVVGSIPIVFADWGIPNPSNAAVSTQDNGLLEFLLVFSRAA
jgi:polyisoprenoid-binding protein YceI